MAIGKRVKVGGSNYKGYKLVVSAPAGDYALDMVLAGSKQAVINAITITPDAYGAGDYFKLEHLTSSTSGILVRTLAETVYNIGAGVSIMFDFSALEDMKPNESLRLTYTNVAGTAINVYTVLERIGVTT
jgi:hypothetical protein